ncbi:MAG: Lrp/AsnC family transcriptional regulator [Burkholderiaceae bacterium]|nr:Lrp/AsnC family transcriptional regulator [Burkholderiaceae bacterium]
MDKIDRAILGLLVRDGRLSFRELGEAVHLSPNAVAERFRRLRATGAIRHIRATLDPVALGRALQAQIEVKLAAETAALEFETALRHLPQVVGATLMTGSFDYAVRVACTDRDELMQLTETLRRTAGVRETYTRLVLREVELAGAP